MDATPYDDLHLRGAEDPQETNYRGSVNLDGRIVFGSGFSAYVLNPFLPVDGTAVISVQVEVGTFKVSDLDF